MLREAGRDADAGGEPWSGGYSRPRERLKFLIFQLVIVEARASAAVGLHLNG